MTRHTDQYNSTRATLHDDAQPCRCEHPPVLPIYPAAPPALQAPTLQTGAGSSFDSYWGARKLVLHLQSGYRSVAVRGMRDEMARQGLDPTEELRALWRDVTNAHRVASKPEGAGHE